VKVPQRTDHVAQGKLAHFYVLLAKPGFSEAKDFLEPVVERTFVCWEPLGKCLFGKGGS
jgi:hypothetical protein